MIFASSTRTVINYLIYGGSGYMAKENSRVKEIIEHMKKKNLDEYIDAYNDSHWDSYNDSYYHDEYHDTYQDYGDNSYYHDEYHDGFVQ